MPHEHAYLAFDELVKKKVDLLKRFFHDSVILQDDAFLAK